MEIELKLLVAREHLSKVLRARAVTAVAHGPARSMRQHSVYYDTPDFELRRPGIGLRLRRQGRSWLQTLKIPGRTLGGLHARDEHEWPLAQGSLDASLLKDTPVRGLFKRKLRSKLGPVFVTDIRRRAIELRFADGSWAELAVDQGEIRAGRRRAPVSEVEIELTAGEPAALFALAFDLLEEVPFRVGHESKAERGYALLAPSPATPRRASPVEIDPKLPASEALVRAMQACAGHARANEDGFLGKADPEYLHQLRVGLRRLRAMLTIPREDDWRQLIDPLRAELKWLWQALGAARNWDVLADEVLPAIAQHDRSEDLEELRRRAARLRRAAVDSAREAVRSARYQRIWLALARLVHVHAAAVAPGSTARQLADNVLDRRYRKVCRWGDPLPTAPEALHRLRIETKKLRYIAHLLASAYGGREGRHFLESLSNLQDVLGTINDGAVSCRLIEEAARAGKQALGRETVGMACGWVAANQDAARRALPDAWRRFAAQQRFWG